MSGLISLAPYREPEPDQDAEPDAQTVTLDSGTPNPASSVVVDLPDGRVSVNFNAAPQDPTPIHDAKFNANLAEHLNDSYLGTLADDPDPIN